MKNNTCEKLVIFDRLAGLITEPKSELNFSNVFQLLIAVMLSAQCTDKRVNLITEKLFKKYQSPADFANANLSDLEEDIKSCNYYRNKAKNIISTSRILVERYNGQVPAEHKELITLPGVGNKTANVVEAVGFGLQALPVDTHILRVSNRLKLTNTKNPNKCEQDLKKIFHGVGFGELHHLLLLFGRYYCTARNPKCDGCVLKDLCDFNKMGE